VTGFLIQQLVNALTIGAIYALIALGYTMVYGVLRLINFAHSEMFMVGGHLAFFLLAATASLSGSAVGVLSRLASSWRLSSRSGSSASASRRRPTDLCGARLVWRRC
jgi:branched-subunit amino acid ABC-type transport system permease component